MEALLAQSSDDQIKEKFAYYHSIKPSTPDEGARAEFVAELEKHFNECDEDNDGIVDRGDDVKNSLAFDW